jgi:hypothetical protein
MVTLHSQAVKAAPFITAMILILAGCKGGAAINDNSLPAMSNYPGAPAWAASEKSSPQLLYVPSAAIPPGDIFEFKLSGTRLRTIEKGISYPLGAAIDGSGNSTFLTLRLC